MLRPNSKVYGAVRVRVNKKDHILNWDGERALVVSRQFEDLGLYVYNFMWAWEGDQFPSESSICVDGTDGYEDLARMVEEFAEAFA